jgi:hypothetical protein
MIPVIARVNIQKEPKRGIMFFWLRNHLSLLEELHATFLLADKDLLPWKIFHNKVRCEENLLRRACWVLVD